MEELYWEHDSLWVATQKLESFYSTIEGFEHVVLATDRNEEGFIAIVVLTADAALHDRQRQHANDITVSPKEKQRLRCLHLLRAKAHSGKLADYETPIGCLVITPTPACPHPWTVDNGLITVTGKVVRSKVKDRYHSDWMAQYSKANQSQPQTNEPKTVDAGLSPAVAKHQVEDAQPATPPVLRGNKELIASAFRTLLHDLNGKVQAEVGPPPKTSEPIVVSGFVFCML